MSSDLTIDTALNDPLIRIAMKADHVNGRDLEAMLRSTARRLDRASTRQPCASMALVAQAARSTKRGFCFA